MSTPPAPQTPLTPAEQQKVKRTLIILYSVMFLMAAIPMVVIWWISRGK